jgi:hypothetical protein
LRHVRRLAVAPAGPSRCSSGRAAIAHDSFYSAACVFHSFNFFTAAKPLGSANLCTGFGRCAAQRKRHQRAVVSRLERSCTSEAGKFKLGSARRAEFEQSRLSAGRRRRAQERRRGKIHSDSAGAGPDRRLGILALEESRIPVARLGRRQAVGSGAEFRLGGRKFDSVESCESCADARISTCWRSRFIGGQLRPRRRSR